MNYLTDKKYVQAWVESFIQAEAHSHLLLGNMQEAYERATRLPFDEGESCLIRQHLPQCCTEFWGAIRSTDGANDDAILTGTRPTVRCWPIRCGCPVSRNGASSCSFLNYAGHFIHRSMAWLASFARSYRPTPCTSR
jgi:hypothetical protein